MWTILSTDPIIYKTYRMKPKTMVPKMFRDLIRELFEKSKTWDRHRQLVFQEKSGENRAW